MGDPLGIGRRPDPVEHDLRRRLRDLRPRQRLVAGRQFVRRHDLRHDGLGFGHGPDPPLAHVPGDRRRPRVRDPIDGPERRRPADLRPGDPDRLRLVRPDPERLRHGRGRRRVRNREH